MGGTLVATVPSRETRLRWDPIRPHTVLGPGLVLRCSWPRKQSLWIPFVAFHLDENLGLHRKKSEFCGGNFHLEPPEFSSAPLQMSLKERSTTRLCLDNLLPPSALLPVPSCSPCARGHASAFSRGHIWKWSQWILAPELTARGRQLLRWWEDEERWARSFRELCWLYRALCSTRHLRKVQLSKACVCPGVRGATSPVPRWVRMAMRAVCTTAGTTCRHMFLPFPLWLWQVVDSFKMSKSLYSGLMVNEVKLRKTRHQLPLQTLGVMKPGVSWSWADFQLSLSTEQWFST